MGYGILSEVSGLTKCAASKAICLAAVTAASVLFGSSAKADSNFLPNPDALSLSPVVDHTDSDQTSQTSESTDLMTAKAQAPSYLDVAPAAEQPNIHGFGDITFTTAYLTPRGLLVVKTGVVIQPIVGLVLPIGDLGPIKNYTLVSGIWNCIAASQGDPLVGPWNEMDFFFSQTGTVGDVIGLNLTYGAWNFPQSTAVAKPQTEHNLDLKVSFDDAKAFNNTSGFSINPYVDLWYAISGSSTVTFGRMGGTGYVEVGMVPTFTINGIPDYPIKVTIPTYVSIGPKNYWGRGGYIGGLSANSASNFGVAYVAVNLSVPLAFIPVRYGHWHADVGVSYDYLINGALLDAGTFLTGNTDRNLVEGSAGFGVNF